MEEINLDRFSDEVLLMVFQYLEPKDILSLENVCKKFKRLINDRAVGRIGDMRWWDAMSNQQFEDFLKGHSQSLRILNLHQCYWLKPATLRKYLARCPNLREVDLCGVEMSPKRLAELLSNAVNLESLGWLDTCKSSEDARQFAGHFVGRSRETLQRLTKLELVFGGRVSHPSLLPLCRDLEILQLDALPGFQPYPSMLHRHHNEELQITGLKKLLVSKLYDLNDCLCLVSKMAEKNRLVESPEAIVLPSRSAVSFKKYLHNVHTLGCNGGDLMEHAQTYLQSKIRVILWNLLSFGDKVVRDIAKGCPQLEGLSIQHSQFASGEGMSAFRFLGESCLRLTQLNLSGCCFHINTGTLGRQGMMNYTKDLVAAITTMKGLKSLALPVCMFNQGAPASTNGNANRSSGSSNRGAVPKRPVGVVREPDTPSDGLLSDVVNGCPEMEEFELIHDSSPFCVYGRSSALPGITDQDLVAISRWPKLCRLTLNGLLAVRLGSLVTIAKKCQELTSLSLANIGPRAHAVFAEALNEALPHLKNLKDIRIQQDTFNCTEVFWDALGQCRKLQRLCVITNKGSCSFEGLVRLFSTCEKLVVCLVQCDKTQKECRALMNKIKNRYSKQRPALCVVVCPVRQRNDQWLSLVRFRGENTAFRTIPKSHYESFFQLQSHVMREESAPIHTLHVTSDENRNHDGAV